MSLFITIAILQIIALAIPGPDFFFVSQTAISRSRYEAMAGVVGIALGVAVWAALALLGLQLLLQKLIWLQRLIAIGGGLYLCWMGVQMLRGAFAKPVESAAESQAMQTTSGAGRSLVRGLFTNLANPKAVVYFGNWPFRIKMLCLIGAGINMAVFHAVGIRGVEAWDEGRPPPNARLAGAISLTLWTLIVATGRWIGFTT